MKKFRLFWIVCSLLSLGSTTFLDPCVKFVNKKSNKVINMRKVFVFISMVVMTTLFSSCATIVSGGDPSITINSSSVFDPVTITTEKQSYPNVTLPAVVQVKRKKLDGQRIRIEAENYKFEDIVLRKTVNGWAFGNILLGGLIGWSIDLMTNCVSKPAQDEFMIEPTFKRKTD